MDFQRNFLIVALAVVSVLLLIAWQDDYNNPAAVTPTSTAAQPAAPGPVTNPVPSSENVESSDLAGLAPAGTATTADVPAVSATNTSGTIRVRTDVFDLQISLSGGDIVDLNLPNFPASLQTPDTPVRLMSSDSTTYVAQSGLVSAAGPDLPSGERAVYVADSTDIQLVDGSGTLNVVLRSSRGNGVTIEKIYRFTRGDYLIGVTYRVNNASAENWSGFLFGQIKRDGSGDPSHPGGGSFFSTSPTYLGGAYKSREAVYNKATFSDVNEAPLKQDMQGGWIAFIQHYFVSAWVPDQGKENHFFTRQNADGHYLFGFTSPQVSVAAGSQSEVTASFYAGPKNQDRLAEISEGLDLTVDYGWFWFISQPLLWLLVQIELIFGNWGVAIILLTVLVKVLFYYPSQVSYRSMAHMRRITPELTRIREEYKNDRQKQSQEMLALYKKEKINPLGGCLPILLQMPVFIALYWVLLESVELRQAPFMLWITDLSVKDPYFVLPILMGISMWIQTKLNPAPPDPMQAKMLLWLPWVFTVFFLFFASGLVLYWLVNNILSIAQQWYITRQIEREHAKP
jgi:YidC/Oxa1 family membrane protein insertase